MHKVNLKIAGLLTLQIIVQPLLGAKNGCERQPGGFTCWCWQQRAAVAQWEWMGLNTPGTKAYTEKPPAHKDSSLFQGSVGA